MLLTFLLGFLYFETYVHQFEIKNPQSKQRREIDWFTFAWMEILLKKKIIIISLSVEIWEICFDSWKTIKKKMQVSVSYIR